ncbi:hypothetical protein KHU50_001306 [Colletotrichum sp. SAR 10_65]|nr:hypothetical protein KHU50_001306 [Colletotrichum sp. SAR 10_65]KAJ5003374.1 hypothetical protein K4K48_011975 [Colletotrichum sp. SAR 10_66]
MRGRLDRFDEEDLIERQELSQRTLQTCLLDPNLAGVRFEDDIRLLGQAKGWCTLLAMDLDLLKGLDQKLQNPSSKVATFSQFLDLLINIHELVWWLSRRPTESREYQHGRSEAERQKALDRDGSSCLFTKAICEVYHIVPFWTLKRPTMVRKLLSTIELLFGEGTGPRFRSSFTSRNADNTAPGENNIVDKCSNMLCLSPELHRFWEKGLFALEPVGHCRRLKASEDSWGVLDTKLSELDLDGTSREEDREIDAKLSSSMFTSASDTEPVITHSVTSKRSSQVDMDLDLDAKKPRTDDKGKTPDTFSKGRLLLKQDMDDGYEYGIVLRFHWLPATTLTKLDAKTPPLDTNPRDIQAPDDNFTSQHYAFSGRPVADGRIIRIWAKNPDELPDWDALRLQWVSLRILRLGGAADPGIYDPHWTDDDENFSFRVENDSESLVQELVDEMASSARYSTNTYE